MKKYIPLLFFVSILLLPIPSFSENDPLREGGTFPDIPLKLSKTSAYQAYLGITGKETIRIPEIKAELVIVEIYSMY